MKDCWSSVGQASALPRQKQRFCTNRTGRSGHEPASPAGAQRSGAGSGSDLDDGPRCPRRQKLKRMLFVEMQFSAATQLTGGAPDNWRRPILPAELRAFRRLERSGFGARRVPWNAGGDGRSQALEPARGKCHRGACRRRENPLVAAKATRRPGPRAMNGGAGGVSAPAQGSARSAWRLRRQPETQDARGRPLAIREAIASGGLFRQRDDREHRADGCDRRRKPRRACAREPKAEQARSARRSEPRKPPEGARQVPGPRSGRDAAATSLDTRRAAEGHLV